MTDLEVKSEFCFPRISINGYRDEVEGHVEIRKKLYSLLSWGPALYYLSYSKIIFETRAEIKTIERLSLTLRGVTSNANGKDDL